MSRNFIAALSGTYNVHANELAHGGGNVDDEDQLNIDHQIPTNGVLGFGNNLSALITSRRIRSQPVQETIKCVVHFLDDSQHIFEVDRTAKGEELMELVFRHLELIEREYFALQFTEMFHHRRSKQESNHYTTANFNGEIKQNNSTVYNKWLDPSKKLRKQLRFCSPPYVLYFRVKFYVTEMSRLLEEYTRYHFYLQLRKDILFGSLTSDESVLATLASYVLQSELGDFCEDDHQPGYSEQFKFIPAQTKEFEKKVESLHRLHQGQTPADAELNYLEEAKHIDLYGVDLHQAKDCEQQEIQIGVSSNGLTIFKNQIKVNTFSWAKIVKISFKRRLFFVQLKHEGTERFDNMIGFNLCSYRACKSLWKSCVEQHTFFRLHTPKPLTKKFFFFFSLGSKFRYSGKTEFQTIEENRKRLTRTERTFIRSNTRNATMPAPSTVQSTKPPCLDAQAHLQNLRKTTVAETTNAMTNGSAHHKPEDIGNCSICPSPPPPPSSLVSSLTGGAKHQSDVPLRTSSCSSGSSVQVDSYTNSGQNHHHNGKLIVPLDKSQEVNQSNSIILSQSKQNCSTSSTSSSSSATSSSNNAHHHILTKDDLISSFTSCDNFQLVNGSGRRTIINIGGSSQNADQNKTKVCSLPTFTSAYSPSTMISLPFIDQEKTSTIMTDSQNIDLSIKGKDEDLNNQCSSQKPDQYVYSPIRELVKELYDIAATSTAHSDDPEKLVSEGETSPVHLVTVTMKPDKEGRFGFNVKGGHDQNCPVLVSRVAPNTPADNAYPTKLHEGDQVVAINGVEVSGLKHDEVVQLIRSTKNIGPDAELVLSIRPNVFHSQCDNDGEDEGNDEPPFQYTLANVSSQYANTTFRSCSGDSDSDTNILNQAKSIEPISSLLDISMNLLQEGLESDSLIIQFEELPRRDEKEKISISRYMENIPKNRYLDIAPYDSTRVILHECISGDYINASYVTMKIETSGITNRYIATQGPLKRTTSDFWQMAWEQKCSMIVMVTPLVEDGRKKCFKYWPDEDQVMLVNDRIELELDSCQDQIAFLERKFKMTDTLTSETHIITHLQYLAWPDQGVPDDDSDFLKLIFKVRELRRSSPDSHVIVHCSAGIGRTGVLILMETGICLIEANQPIYPLELVSLMRSQRAMLIQTSTQFRFVCEALYRVYHDSVVTPLKQYS